MVYNVIAVAVVILFILVIVALWFKRDEAKALIIRTFAVKPKAIYAPDQSPSKAEWGKRQTGLNSAGVPQNEIEPIVGMKNSDFTRREIAENMILYARNLPKG